MTIRITKKRVVLTVLGILALHLLVWGFQNFGEFMDFLSGNHPNNYSDTLAAAGFSNDRIIADVANPAIEHNGSWNGCTEITRVVLADKAGKSQLISLFRDHEGRWYGPDAAEPMEGDYEGLETIAWHSYPQNNTYGFGVPPEEEDAHPELARDLILRWDWFYHGTNAAATIEIPEEALPTDSTVQIYQRGEEYVLHFVAYLKRNQYRDGGFRQAYLALKDSGCVR